jgi:hypothetical protein
MFTLALTWSVSVVVVPEVILSASQGADSVMLHVNNPPVGLATFMVFASGVVPPAVPEKLRLIGFRSMLGVAGVPPLETTRLTATDAVWW